MERHPGDEPSGTRNEGVRFEKTDVEARAIVRFGLVLAAVTSVVALLLIALQGFLGRLEAEKDPPPAPLSRFAPGRQPPEPRLQEQPFADVERLQAEQRAVLEGYGWVDREKGLVRIPIDEALARVVQRGLPARDGASPPHGKEGPR